MTNTTLRFTDIEDTRDVLDGNQNDLEKLIRQMVVEEQKAGHAPRESAPETTPVAQAVEAAPEKTNPKSRLKRRSKEKEKEKPFTTLLPQEELNCPKANGKLSCLLDRVKTALTAMRRNKKPRTAATQTAPGAHGATAKVSKVTAPRGDASTSSNLFAKLERRHVKLAVLALLVIFKPYLVVGIVLVVLFFMLATYGTLGPEGMGDMIRSMYQWYKKRRPERAERVRARLDAFAVRADAFLDKVPGKWTESLYLPDFGPDAMNGHTEAVENDPFDRLSREHA